MKLIGKLDREKNGYDLFRDFCELAYCAHAKLTVDAERGEMLEQRYMQIVGTYRNKDTVRAFPELLAIAWRAIEQGDCDFLGSSAASPMGVLNAKIGQFFTPYSVSRLIAQMSLQDVGAIIEANGFVTIAEPACGAGGMMLAEADTLQQNGFDPSLHMLVNAVDSPLCFHMTCLQTTPCGIPALVELGDTLRNTRTERAWTLSTTAFYTKHGKLFP
jgi:hypothetical protein